MCSNYAKILGSKTSKLSIILVVGVLLILLPRIATLYMVVLAFYFFVYLTLAQSWNLAGGYCNLISLGQGAFAGLGAYTTFLLYFSGVPVEFGLIAGGLIAAFLAFLLSKPLFRLRGVYFTIGTLALVEILKLIVIRLPYLGGSWGLHITSPPPYYSSMYLYYLSLIFGVTACLVMWKIVTSRMGWALKCIRSDEDESELVGINTYRYKVYAFIFHAFFASVMGGLLALYTLHIEPYSIFSLALSIEALTITLIGGRGTFLGPFVGAAIMVVLSHFLAAYYTLHLVILGAILLVIILFFPDGLIGRLQRKFNMKIP
ncbi:MAG: branched-chain amino acid ABC transporter permease [Candidatus Bathyarchaeia archaeon]